MTEMQSAIGIHELAPSGQRNLSRYEYAAMYDEAFEGLPAS